MQATVRYLTNGYSVAGTGAPGEPPESYYAATLDEAVFWVGQILDATAERSAERAAREPARAADPATDPLISQEAEVFPLTGGGFITRALQNFRSNLPTFDEYCFSMDEVHAALVKIYTYVPPAPDAARMV